MPTLVFTPPGMPMPTCVRCGQVHRTWAGVELPEGFVGEPCLADGDVLGHAFPGADCFVRDVLGDHYEGLGAWAMGLATREDTITEEEAGYARLLRYTYIPKALKPHLFEAFAEWLRTKDAAVTDSLEGEWMGQVKERISAVVKVTRISGPFAGEYGDSWLCVMEEEGTGNSCIWWTGDNLAFDEDCVYSIRGTVKKQEVYHGRRQTVLTRVKEVILDERNSTEPSGGGSVSGQDGQTGEGKDEGPVEGGVGSPDSGQQD